MRIVDSVIILHRSYPIDYDTWDMRILRVPEWNLGYIISFSVSVQIVLDIRIWMYVIMNVRNPLRCKRTPILLDD